MRLENELLKERTKQICEITVEWIGSDVSTFNR